MNQPERDALMKILVEARYEVSASYDAESYHLERAEELIDNAIAALLAPEQHDERPVTLTDAMIDAEAERRYAARDNGNADRWVRGFKDGVAWARKVLGAEGDGEK